MTTAAPVVLPAPALPATTLVGAAATAAADHQVDGAVATRAAILAAVETPAVAAAAAAGIKA